jgi:hypothetical protein
MNDRDPSGESVVETPATCGAGLALSAVLPAKAAKVFAALAEMLELHRGTLVSSDPHAPGEDEAYRALAADYREIAPLLERVAARMASYHDLPMPEHDPNAFGPQQRAFEVLAQAESELLATLERMVQSHQELLAEPDT